MSTSATEPILRVQHLDAGYQGVAVVHDVGFDVHPGEVVALLGANGAGKTTTLSTISGLLPVLGGEISVVGRELRTGRRPPAPEQLARDGLAHVPEDRCLFASLTVAENLRLGLRRVDSRGVRARQAIDDILAPFPALLPLLDRSAGLLSGGEQQMLAIARSLAGRPRLLMVDELSLGLAPLMVETLLPTLRSIAAEYQLGVLVVEQHVPLVLAIADRAVVLAQGRVVSESAAADLANRQDLLEASYLGGTPDEDNQN